MIHQILTSCCGPMWLAIVRADSPLALDISRNIYGCRQDTLRNGTHHLRLCFPSQPQFLIDRARHHSNRTRQFTSVRDKLHNSRWEHKLLSLSQVQKVMLDTCVQATRWIMENDESSALTTALTFKLYCGFRWTTAVLILISAIVYPLLPALSNYRITLTQMSSNCSIRLTSLFNPIEWPLPNSDICL